MGSYKRGLLYIKAPATRVLCRDALSPGAEAGRGEEARAPLRVDICSRLEGPSQEHFALPPGVPGGVGGGESLCSKASFDMEGRLPSSRWAGHVTWNVGAIIPPILQRGKIRLREAKSLVQVYTAGVGDRQG